MTNTKTNVVPAVLIWGTYDLSKPRTRLLIKAIEREYGIADRINGDLWRGMKDKSQLKGVAEKLRILVRMILLYPKLIFRYVRSPSHQLVVIPYFGLLDLLVLWPFARLRGVKICLDMFISLYDTVVIDRQLLDQNGVLAKSLFGFEWFVLRLADKLLIDTKIHARYVERLYRLKPGSIGVVWVGVEEEYFGPGLRSNALGAEISVLFYGQFIPLHGLDVIVDAAEILKTSDEKDIEFVIVGSGQLQPAIDRRIKEKRLFNIRRIPWVAYADLNQLIADADICLGIFAKDGKALRVIPNKVFQIVAANKPLITGDTPALRELSSASSLIVLIQPGQPKALAAAIINLAARLKEAEQTCTVSPPSVGIETLAKQVKVSLGEILD